MLWVIERRPQKNYFLFTSDAIAPDEICVYLRSSAVGLAFLSPWRLSAVEPHEFSYRRLRLCVAS